METGVLPMKSRGRGRRVVLNDHSRLQTVWPWPHTCGSVTPISVLEEQFLSRPEVVKAPHLSVTSVTAHVPSTGTNLEQVYKEVETCWQSTTDRIKFSAKNEGADNNDEKEKERKGESVVAVLGNGLPAKKPITLEEEQQLIIVAQRRRIQELEDTIENLQTNSAISSALLTGFQNRCRDAICGTFNQLMNDFRSTLSLVNELEDFKVFERSPQAKMLMEAPPPLATVESSGPRVSLSIAVIPSGSQKKLPPPPPPVFLEAIKMLTADDLAELNSIDFSE